MSGIVLSVTDGPVAAPKDALRALLPVVPATRRDFTRTRRGDCVFEGVSGWESPLAPLALQVQLRSATGALVFQRQQDVPVTLLTLETTSSG